MTKTTTPKHIVTFICLIALLFTGCGKEAPEPVQEKKIAVTSPSVSDILEEKTATSGSEAASGLSTNIEKTTQDSIDILDEASSESSVLSEIQSSEESTTLSSTEGIEVDLTALSATAVYGEVYNMMYYPEKYVGKNIRMNGIYSSFFDQATGKHYHACIIMDATACCAQGIEFILTDDYKYPDDYPSDGDDIIVEGTFDTYEEESGMYCTLRNASLLE